MNTMNEVIKFTDIEMQSIAKLQADYQQNIFALGQLELEEVDLNQQLKQIHEQRSLILDNWKKLQLEESNLINSLSQKYGDGKLNISNGTFTPLPQVSK